MDDFDGQFADELEALADVSEPGRPNPRKSLQFEMPKNIELTDASVRSPIAQMSGYLLGEENRNGSLQKKRARKEQTQSDSDLEYDDDDDYCDLAVPASKKIRVDTYQLDDEELWDGDLLHSLKIKVKSLHDVKVKKKSSEVVEEVETLPSPDRQAIERILEHRNKQTVREFSIDIQSGRNVTQAEDYDFERQRVFKRIPTTSYLPTTGTEGNRVYMELKDDLEYVKQFDSSGKTLGGSSLLNVPISVLREQLEEERRNMLIAESQRLSEDVRRQLNEDQGFMDDNDDEDKENQAPSLVPECLQNLLWVEKYTPQRYTDLLSEENINRTLLHWLKMWDYVVFDKDLPIKPKEKKREQNKKNKKKNQPEVLDELDKHKRPLQKVALLCGPPGLGKTTLAHIIAKHAGYNVVEMNASDDRTAEVFKNKIESATQMKAVLGADPRPNCLVIDEIDGAPQAAINVLLNVIKKSDSGEEGKKKKDEGEILRRPIICICNDQYVPALRQLRQIAMILNFPQTEPTKLAGRLYEVVQIEKLRSDMNTLLALCEKTDNDIRSCLNTLQFIHGQCKELNIKNVQAMAVGQKDSHKSLFSVWYDVLTLPKPRRQKFVNVQDAGVKDLVLNTSPSARFNSVLSVVQGAGEYDKLTQGLFENYLDCKFKDPYMDGVSMATDWLCYNDHISQYIQHLQDYRLMPYLPYLPVVFHFLFASNTVPKIQYPHGMVDFNVKKTKCENLVTCMMTDISPSVRKFINVSIIVGEILPSLIEIIQPTFRPVNTQLYSSKEKEDLHQLVKIMISYNLTYHQEKSLEGQYTYIVEPHVDEVVKFPGLKQTRQLSYASKQLVAREIELEKMRRSEQARVQLNIQEQDSMPSGKDSGKKEETKTPVVPNHLQRLTAKPLGKQEESQVKDFFGRVVKKTTPDSKSDKSGDKKIKTNVLVTDIWFHFQQGYSNAVRRNVKVKEFF